MKIIKIIIITMLMIGTNTIYAQTKYIDLDNLQNTIQNNKNIKGQKRQLKLLKEIEELKIESDEEFKVEQINFIINKMNEYKSDKEIWKQIDYWTSPLEFLNEGLGDCEDYAIAKYYSLIKTGIIEERLILLLVNAHNNNKIEKHVVLGYFKSPIELWILDVSPKIELAQDRKDLEILESFNQKGYYKQLTKMKTNNIFSNHWEKVKEKAEKEGW